MTITALPSRDEYTSSAGQTVFNYSFKIYESSNLDVYVTPAGQVANDAADLTTAYVVDPNTIGNPTGGLITFNSPLSNGDLVTIVSSVPYDRTVDYQVNGDFLPTTVNGDNDRQVSQIKQVLTRANRTLTYPQSLQSATSLTLPTPEAGLFLKWKTDLTGLENTDVDASFLPITGGTMAGDINMGGYNIVNIGNGFLPLSGGTMTGSINMGDNDISNIDLIVADRAVIGGSAIIPGGDFTITIAEQVTLTDGQVVVVFLADTAGATFYVNGLSVDSGLIIEDLDYQIDNVTKTMTLVNSYPAGTILTMRYFDGDSGIAPTAYDSVAAMKSTVLPIGKLVTTKGYYAPGDGGGADYLVAASQAVDGFGSHVMTNGNVALLQVPGVLNITTYGIKADGVTDDTVAWAALAAQTTYTNMLMSGGVSVIGIKTTFTESDITFAFTNGAKVLQKAGTQSLDTLLKFNGNNVRLKDFNVDGNLVNNPTYTGRNELVKIAGDYCTLQGFTGRGVSNGDFAAALYVTGRYGRFESIYTYDTGTNAVRDQGDYNEFIGLNMFEWGQHGFVKDTGYQGAASNYTLIKDVIAISNKAEANMEGILFDHDGVQGGLCQVKNVVIECLSSTGPDALKFAYMKRVELSNVKVNNAEVAAFRVSLRLQQEVEQVTLHDCVLAGSVNLDATVDCDMVISGNTIIGNDFNVNAGIEDFTGKLSIADGVQLRNLQDFGITLDATSSDSKITVGRLVLHGANSFSPSLVNQPSLTASGSKRRAVAGNITVRTPSSTEGTMRNFADDARWITTGDKFEAGAAYTGDRLFLVGNGDFPPREVEGYLRSDVIRRRAPSPSQVVEIMCTTAGASCTTLWVAATGYTVGDWRFNGSNVYVCSIAGTSAGSGGPTGTGAGIVDGTASWDYVSPLAVFKDTVSTTA
jgi:hypothetical protein